MQPAVILSISLHLLSLPRALPLAASSLSLSSLPWPLPSAPSHAPLLPLLISLPSGIADSEIALHVETERLHLHAGAPELFPDLVPLGLAQSLSSLLIHDNADLIAAATVLLVNLTDFDDPSDLISVQALTDALVDANAVNC
jgi:hypothetical protein